jgi:hypothetical protein
MEKKRFFLITFGSLFVKNNGVIFEERRKAKLFEKGKNGKVFLKEQAFQNPSDFDKKAKLVKKTKGFFERMAFKILRFSFLNKIEDFCIASSKNLWFFYKREPKDFDAFKNRRLSKIKDCQKSKAFLKEDRFKNRRFIKILRILKRYKNRRFL